MSRCQYPANVPFLSRSVCSFKAVCHAAVLFSTALILLLISVAPGYGADTITWMEAVAPPFFIHNGPLKGQGYEDIMSKLLDNTLSQYEHKHMQANISRHYQQWKQGEQACSLAMFRTPEREKFAYFSIPSVFTLPTVLIIDKSRLAQFGGQHRAVSLCKILKENKLVIGRSDNRSYGVEFDRCLDSFGTASNIFSYEGPELSLNLFKMLKAGRIDALAGLPEEAMYLAETLGIRDQIMTLPIQENQGNTSASLTYVACSKTEWGKKTISAINEALLTLRPSDSYRAAYERWLDPESIPGYRALYNDVFLKTTE